MIHDYKGISPNIHKSAFVANDAVIIGDVTIDEDASIWFKTVIRGDVDSTHIGKRVNIQDLSMIHQSPDLPVVLEDDVSIGHQATLHGCIIRRKALIGMRATILDGVEIGERAFIGAGSLVTPGTKIPANTLAVGSPARVIRELTEEDYKMMEHVRKSYLDKGHYYKNHTNLGSENS